MTASPTIDQKKKMYAAAIENGSKGQRTVNSSTFSLFTKAGKMTTDPHTIIISSMHLKM